MAWLALLDENVGWDEVEAAAARCGWQLINALPAKPDHAAQRIYAAGAGAYLHVVEDDSGSARFLAGSGDEAEALFARVSGELACRPAPSVAPEDRPAGVDPAGPQAGAAPSQHSEPPPQRLPHRPRLSEQGMLRRHVVDGEAKLMLHDSPAEEILEISAQQLEQLLACDGTRDLGGVMLAAAQRGAAGHISQLSRMLGELHGRGLLADGVPTREQVLLAMVDGYLPPDDRPVLVLPDFSLRCDGHGSCCTTYSTVGFTGDDVRRALQAVPDAARDAERVFLPLYGSAPSDRFAVSMHDGRCAFLADDRRCRIHAARGAGAKPSGCRSYPGCYVDDGVAIRVSATVECACVLRSDAERPSDGEPLCRAQRAADIPEETPIALLPSRVAVGAAHTAPREALGSWADEVVEAAAACPDAIAAAWTLAGALDEGGLDARSSAKALAASAAPSVADLGFLLLALAGKTADKRASTAAWRSPRDATRRLGAWIDDAAQALTDGATVRERLHAPSPHPRHEAFYLRSTLWGHQAVSLRMTLAQSLRDRAVRMLLARQCAVAAASLPPVARALAFDEVSAGYPLTAVEAMMRGQGLAGYTAGMT